LIYFWASGSDLVISTGESPASEISAAMETLASAMRRENRRSKAPSSSSVATALASGRVPLVMAFLSCLAWLYVAGRYVPPTRSDPRHSDPAPDRES